MTAEPESPRERGTSVQGRGIAGWVRQALAAVSGGRGAKEPPAPLATDRSTLLAKQRTRLAVRRSSLAAERTLMAWIRT